MAVQTFLTGNNSNLYIPELNTFRFLFMLLIFFHHMNKSTLFPPGGPLGVSFFFVLSGFSMTIGYHDRILQKDFSYKRYIARRMTKFYPIHWLVLLYILVTQWQLFAHSELFFAKLATNFLLLQSFVPLKDFYFSFNSPSWYLCNTLFYCFIFPFILKAIIKCDKRSRTMVLLFCIVLYVFIVSFLPKEYHHAILYVNPIVRLLDFLLGIYTGLYLLEYRYKQLLIDNEKLLLFVIFLCFAIISLISLCRMEDDLFSHLEGLYIYSIRFLWIAFCPMLLSVSLLSIIRKRDEQQYGDGVYFVVKLLRKAGKYSFTFYMIHLVCRDLIGAVCYSLGLGSCLSILVILIGTMIASIFLQKFFVDPVSKVLMN